MRTLALIFASAALVATIGCRQETPTGESSQTGNASAEASEYLLGEEPTGVTEVIEMRENAKDGDDVVVIGRIGGSTNPWIEGRAAFTLVDSSLKACSDIPGDACETPWDYCCETDKLPDATTLVKVVDESGDLVKTDARKLLNVKELSTVVVQGKANHDDSGNVTVLARRIYVKK